MNTKTIGTRTEAVVLAALVKLYPTVLIPFGDNSRYDLVFQDEKGSFLSVQCKTGRYKNGVIHFNGYSSTENRKNGVSKDYRGDVDYFAVNCPGLPEVYLIPVIEVGTTKISIRVEPTKDYRGQHQIRWAKGYLIN